MTFTIFRTILESFILSMHPKRTISGYFLFPRFSDHVLLSNEFSRNFRILFPSRLMNFLEKFILFDPSETYDILFFLSSEHDDEFYFQTNLHPFDVSETRNFQIFLFSHFLNTIMFYSRQTNPHTIRCGWNVRHSFVPILKAC